jgi:hypothetical protein
MPEQTRTARYRTPAYRVKRARRDLMTSIYNAIDEDYEAGEQHEATRSSLQPLAAVLDRFIADAKVKTLGSEAIHAVLVETPEVVESMTILCAYSRTDRVHAAVYSVKLTGGLTEETLVTRDDPLRRLASDIAIRVLAS